MYTADGNKIHDIVGMFGLVSQRKAKIKLSRVQRLYITGAIKSVPTVVMETMLNLSPFGIYITG